mgnify:CR=1 FL=1
MKPNPSKGVFRRAAIMAGSVLSGAALIGASSLPMSGGDLKPGEIGAVRSIVDGDTLYMDSGLKVRLSASQAPKLPLGRAGFKAWPFGNEAKAALTELTDGKTLQLFYGGQERDRYDRALAQVFTLDADGKPDLWVQEDMIRMGWARVYTWPDTWQDSERLYAAERAARANNRGIWGHPYYAIRTPAPNVLAQDVDSFQLVEGIITSTADVRGRVYLNFGADYKTDFTVAIDKKHRKRFKKAGLDLLSLEGARVRVRGWIELTNGPVIWLDHPERLEVLD